VIKVDLLESGLLGFLSFKLIMDIMSQITLLLAKITKN